MQYDLRHKEERDGFTVKLWTAPETDISIRESFDEDEAGFRDLEDKVERGVYEWFMARVTAERAGVVLGEDHLGGCMYESAEEFRAPGGYYDDMVAMAVDGARAKLAELRSDP